MTSPAPSQWSVCAPLGERQWSGARSQRAAFDLARSLAGIDAMLAHVHRPALVAVPEPARDYGRYSYPQQGTMMHVTECMECYNMFRVGEDGIEICPTCGHDNNAEDYGDDYLGKVVG